MGFDSAVEGERWLRYQGNVIGEILERAAGELDAVGIRLLAGSADPMLEDLDGARRISLLPLRFSQPKSEDSLSLRLTATTKGGPPRYLVALQVSGPLACGSLRRLAIEFTDIWEKAYLSTGLWIGEGRCAQRLTQVSQITHSLESSYLITGPFLPSDPSRTIQHGLMTMGVLYRSVLDEIAGAVKLRRLHAQLSSLLGNRPLIFQRLIRP